MALNKKLLEILMCPRCHGAVRWDKKLGGLVCCRCKLLYEVKNDMPIMLLEAAKYLHEKLTTVCDPIRTD